MIPTDYTEQKRADACERSSRLSLPPINQFKPITFESNPDFLHQNNTPSKNQRTVSRSHIEAASYLDQERVRTEATAGVAKHIGTTLNKRRVHRILPLEQSYFTTSSSQDHIPSKASEETKKSETHRPLDRDLIKCIKDGHLEDFKVLSASIDINRPLHLDDNNTFPPLVWAIAANQLSICQYLIEERDATIDTIDGIKKGNVPLIIRALNADSPSIAKYLYSQNAFLNEPFSYSNRNGPPLTYYASLGILNLVQFLVENLGANVNVQDSKGKSPLYYILELLSVELKKSKYENLCVIAKLLVDYDANVEETDPFGNTLLMQFTEKKMLAVVKILTIDLLADTQAKNNFGEDALSIVFRSLNEPNLTESDILGLEDLFCFLIQNNSKEQIKVKFYEQIRLKNERACTLLQKHCRFDIDEPIDSEKNTLLIEFTRKGMIDHLIMLLKLGANPEKENLRGISAYSYANKKLNEFDFNSKVNWQLIFQNFIQTMTMQYNSDQTIKSENKNET